MTGAPVYRDGIKAERCSTCQSLLKAPDGEAMVSIRLSDLEEVISILVEYVDCPPVWGATIRRFEQAAGRTWKQIQAEARASRRATVTGEHS